MDITLSTLPRPVVAEGNIYVIRFYNMVRVIPSSIYMYARVVKFMNLYTVRRHTCRIKTMKIRSKNKKVYPK